MKIVIASLLIASGILSGCVVEPAYRGDYHGGYGYRDGVPNRPDRDRDGVSTGMIATAMATAFAITRTASRIIAVAIRNHLQNFPHLPSSPEGPRKHLFPGGRPMRFCAVNRAHEPGVFPSPPPLSRRARGDSCFPPEREGLWG